MSTRFRKLATAATAGLLGVFILSNCAPADPVIGTAAGYALAAPVGKQFNAVAALVTVPKLTCARAENSTARIWAGLDGVTFARNPAVNAKAGLILACKNGTATYTPYYGIYFRGTNSPDKFFQLFGIKAGDTLNIEVGQRLALTQPEVTFREQVNTGKVPANEASATVTAPQIQGTSAECYAEAPRDPALFARFFTITFHFCDADQVQINREPGLRALSVTTKSGEVLTRTHSYPSNPYATPFEIRRSSTVSVSGKWANPTAAVTISTTGGVIKQRSGSIWSGDLNGKTTFNAALHADPKHPGVLVGTIDEVFTGSVRGIGQGRLFLMEEITDTARGGVVVVATIVRGDGGLNGVTGRLLFAGSSDIRGIGDGVYAGTISH